METWTINPHSWVIYEIQRHQTLICKKIWAVVDSPVTASLNKLENFEILVYVGKCQLLCFDSLGGLLACEVWVFVWSGLISIKKKKIGILKQKEPNSIN